MNKNIPATEKGFDAFSVLLAVGAKEARVCQRILISSKITSLISKATLTGPDECKNVHKFVMVIWDQLSLNSQRDTNSLRK